MKTIEMLKNEKYYAPLYDLIEDELDKWSKACGWRVLTEERYVDAMGWIAKSWDVDVNALRAYYED